MQRRTHESPMDFEWQTGPALSATSPFTHLTQRQGQKTGFGGFASPSKENTAANTQSSNFSSATNTAAPPFRNPAFTTPRKAFDPDLFSETSGAESSPADNADAEDTPETNINRAAMTTFSNQHTIRKPIFGRFGADYKGNSPGRGELRRGKYADGIGHKVRKRKRIDREYSIQYGRRGSYESESDSEDGRQGKTERSSSRHIPPKENWWSSFFGFIESKPTLPYILSTYTQFIFNAFFVLCGIYILWSFIMTIKADVDKAMEAEKAVVLGEMAQCAKEYADNRCSPDKRAPALDSLCKAWEVCMNRDLEQVGRAKVSAHTFAMIFNSFVEPISWKAMIFAVVIFAACISANNLAFPAFRSKVTHPPHAPQYSFPTAPTHPQGYQWGPPQTPRHVSGQDMYLEGLGTPFQAIMPSQTPGNRGSPRKGSWQ